MVSRQCAGKESEAEGIRCRLIQAGNKGRQRGELKAVALPRVNWPCAKLVEDYSALADKLMARQRSRRTGVRRLRPARARAWDGFEVNAGRCSPVRATQIWQVLFVSWRT